MHYRYVHRLGVIRPIKTKNDIQSPNTECKTLELYGELDIQNISALISQKLVNRFCVRLKISR